MKHPGDTTLARGELRRAVFDQRSARGAPTFSLQRMLRSLADGEPMGGFEGELVNHTTALRGGNPFIGGAHTLPFEVLQGFGRDLTVALPSGGGYLTGTDTAAPVGPFAGSVARRLGVRIEPGAKNSVSIPVVNDLPTMTWLTMETSAGGEQTPLLGSAAMSPKTASAVFDVASLHLRQAESESFLRRYLMATADAAIDTALFAGTGASGQPTGLTLNPAIPSYNGASFDMADAAAVEKLVGDELVDDSSARWAAATGVRETLRNRVRVASTDSRTIWGDANAIIGRPALASSRMPAAGLLYGHFSEVSIPLWGPGVDIAVDPYTQFRERIVRFRVLVSLDVVAARPGALVRVASFS